MHYLTQKGEKRKILDLDEKEKVKVPKFFVYPKQNYLTTIQKAPMAHKTFSQEQFAISYYTLSISFVIKLPNTKLNKHKNSNAKNLIYPVRGINNSVYLALYLLKSMPYFSTNML